MGLGDILWDIVGYKHGTPTEFSPHAVIGLEGAKASAVMPPAVAFAPPPIAQGSPPFRSQGGLRLQGFLSVLLNMC
jgi:hypothetical protein